MLLEQAVRPFLKERGPIMEHKSSPEQWAVWGAVEMCSVPWAAGQPCGIPGVCRGHPGPAAEAQAAKQHPQLHAIFPEVRKVVFSSFPSCLLLQCLLLPSASNYWARSLLAAVLGHCMQTGNQPIWFPALCSGSSCSWCRGKGTFTTKGRRGNHPVSLQAEVHPLWSQEEGGHPTLLTDQTHFSLILENIIMHSLKNSSNILPRASGLYSCFVFF